MKCRTKGCKHWYTRCKNCNQTFYCADCAKCDSQICGGVKIKKPVSLPQTNIAVEKVETDYFPFQALAFTLDTPPEYAVKRFNERYGQAPKKVMYISRFLVVGPIPNEFAH